MILLISCKKSEDYSKTKKKKKKKERGEIGESSKLINSFTV